MLSDIVLLDRLCTGQKLSFSEIYSNGSVVQERNSSSFSLPLSVVMEDQGLSMFVFRAPGI